MTASSTTLSSGIRELTVTAASGTGAPTVGDKAHMILIPGFAAVLKPLAASSDQVIPLILSGTCPKSDTLMNVIDMNDDAGTDNNNTVAAKITLGASNFVMNTNDTFDRDGDSTNTGFGTVDHSCSNSVSDISIGGNTSTLYLNAGGGAIVHAKDGAGSTDGIYTAVPQMSADIQASDVASKNVVIIGLTGGNAFGGKGVFQTNGNVLVTPYNADMTTAGTAIGTLTFAPIANTKGFFNSTLGNAKMICAGNPDVGGTGKLMAACTGNSDISSYSVNNNFNLILAEQ